MTISQSLRDYCCKSFGLANDANEADVKSLLVEKMLSGELTKDKVNEINESDAEARIADIVNKRVEAALTQKGVSLGTEVPSKATDGQKAYGSAASAGSLGTADNGNIRVKSVVEQFDNTRSEATYDQSRNGFMKKNFGGQRVHTGDDVGARYLDNPSDRDMALAGAWFKHLATKSCHAAGRPVPQVFRKTELDQRLVEYAVQEEKFLGPVGYVESQKSAQTWFENDFVGDMWKKALLDDTVSGGLEATPTVFDSAAILTPLLHGELLPMVTVKNISGRRIEGFAMANPTWEWGTQEGSAIGLFDTTNFISGFDVNVHPVTGCMELGRDFQSDSPVAIGKMVVARYGESLKKELDDVIAIGNGITQPEGIFNSPGVATFASANGVSGPLTVGDFEALHFGVSKQFEAEAGNRCSYVSTQSTYKNARGIQVDDANDQRRVFGMDQKTWELFDYPFKINTAVSNSMIAFVCWNRYRMYRRQGMEVTIEQGGADLQRRHMDLVKVRARYGGALDHAEAMCKMVDAKA